MPEDLGAWPAMQNWLQVSFISGTRSWSSKWVSNEFAGAVKCSEGKELGSVSESELEGGAKWAEAKLRGRGGGRVEGT